MMYIHMCNEVMIVDRDMQLIKSDNVLHWAKSMLGYVVQEESKLTTIANHWPTVGQPLANHWPAMGKPLANHWPAIGQQSANHWPTIRQPLASHWPTIVILFSKYDTFRVHVQIQLGIM